MSEEKKEEIKKYYTNLENIPSSLANDEPCYAIYTRPKKDFKVLVEESEYKKLAGELKYTQHVLKQKIELIDKKNQEIDQLSDSTKTVPESTYLELKEKAEEMRKLLVKLGAAGKGIL